MKTMKNLMPLLALLLLACASASEFSKDPYWVKTFQLNGPGNLVVETSGGSITVEGHDQNLVRIEMFIHQGGRQLDSTDAKAKEVLENYEITIDKTGNNISAIAKRNNSSWFSGNNASISFKMLVPRQMASNLNTSGGSINVSGVEGKQEIKTSGGSLNLKAINGNMNAKTSGGSIHIEDYSGTLDAHTSGGSINLSNAKGDLKVGTSGGSINIKGVAGGLEASTSGGSIHADIKALTNRLALKTSGGSITATLPGGLGMDLDLKGNRVNTKLTNFDGEVEKDKVVGKMNGGGIPVSMSTSGGSVNLEYQ